MPSIFVNGVNLYYEEHGAGEETIVFAHGLLWSHKMFEAQISALSQSYRVIAYDHRGQGKSEVKGPFDMDTVADDAIALIDTLQLGKVHFAGLSMGDLVKSLILLETSANAEPVENLPKYKTLNGIVKWVGIIPPVANKVMHIMFAESWLEDKANQSAIKRWKKELMGNRKSITGPVEGVIYRKGVEEELGRIGCPTLVIVGDEDVATKPEKAKVIQMGIPGARLHVIPGAGHSSCIEKPVIVSQLLKDWLQARS
jgi:pimeloyl-ACP methyl ester carboxylesterase